MTRFVVALAAEARPLIARYRLEPTGTRAFRTYSRGRHRLVISGVGKVAAAAATASLDDEARGVWLNVGIAGHRDRAPGTFARAHRITDAASGHRHYPTLVGLSQLDSVGVTTVDRPETEFGSSDLFDMEAAGFYPTALRFSTSELVQCVKIVSDNRLTGTDTLDRARVSELVEQKLEAIDTVVTHLESLAAELEPAGASSHVDAFTDSWRFTTSEKRQLEKLLVRLRAFAAPAALEDYRHLKTASAVLSAMSETLRDRTREQSTF